MQKSEGVRYDPYFSEIPWDIITDENGKVIGEVYLVHPKDLPEWIKPRKKVRSYHQYKDTTIKPSKGGYTHEP